MSDDTITPFDLFHLSQDDPKQLLKLVADGTFAPETLATAAQYAGSLADTPAVVAALLPLLAHAAAVVREGAVLGLERHRTKEVLAALEGLATKDEDPMIRSLAQETLRLP